MTHLLALLWPDAQAVFDLGLFLYILIAHWRINRLQRRVEWHEETLELHGQSIDASSPSPPPGRGPMRVR